MARESGYQAGFPVVAGGAVMGWRGQPVPDHFLLGEIFEGRMQCLELLEILEHGLDHLINGFRRSRRRGYESGADSESGHVFVAAPVHAARNDGAAVIGAVGDEGLDLGAVHGDDEAIAGSRCFLDRTGGMPDREYHGVDIVVAERPRLFGRFELGNQGEVVSGPAVRPHHDFHGRALSRTGIADIDTLPLEIGNMTDTGIRAGDDGEGLRMDRKDRTQVRKRPLGFEFVGAVIGVVLPVRLDHAHVQVAAADRIQIINRTTRALHRAANVVLGPISVDEATDGAAGRVVDAGNAPGADGNELWRRFGAR